MPLPAARTRWIPEESTEAAAPAVTLGFRDGSTVEVLPDSEEARALRDAAAALVARER